MRHESVFAITAFSFLLLVQPASAQSFAGVAQDTCQQAVSAKVKGGNSDASDFAFGNAKIKQSEMKTDVKGSGHFDSGKGKASFNYSCAYNITTGDASDVHVNVQNATASN
jgi:hypothetical protein